MPIWKRALWAGSYFFFYLTEDAGETWKQINKFRTDAPEDPNSVKIESLDGDNYWVWIDSAIAVTHDGGATWITWPSQQIMDERLYRPYGLIADVSFDTSQTGTMHINAWHHSGGSFLKTKDGGKSWD